MRKIVYLLFMLIIVNQAAFADNIQDEATFRSVIVDKPLVGEGWDPLIISADGIMNGSKGTEVKLTGPWYFKDGYFCREAIVNGKSYGTDCQVVESTQDGVVFITNKGKGDRKSYRFKK